MEREIKFRGRDKDGKWHYGYYYEDGMFAYILDLDENDFVKHELIDVNTVGQYTGLKDINGKEIFEGDIVKGMEVDCLNCPQVRLEKCDNTKCVKKEIYRDVASLARTRFWLENESFGYDGEELLDSEIAEIIGNIYDNPKLLKK